MDTFALERKFCTSEKLPILRDGSVIEGYASLFGRTDRGGDIVEPGAYTRSLRRIAEAGGRVKMLWQHDPSRPIGVWDEVVEDGKGLRVKGRLLNDVAQAREAAVLLGAGAIDGLSIGYRTLRATKDAEGRRHLDELDLWEVSLVTFPMLPDARVGSKAEESDEADALRDLAAALEGVRRELTAAT